MSKRSAVKATITLIVFMILTFAWYAFDDGGRDRDEFVKRPTPHAIAKNLGNAFWLGIAAVWGLYFLTRRPKAPEQAE